MWVSSTQMFQSIARQPRQLVFFLTKNKHCNQIGSAMSKVLLVPTSKKNEWQDVKQLAGDFSKLYQCVKFIKIYKKKSTNVAQILFLLAQVCSKIVGQNVCHHPNFLCVNVFHRPVRKFLFLEFQVVMEKQWKRKRPCLKYFCKFLGEPYWTKIKFNCLQRLSFHVSFDI